MSEVDTGDALERFLNQFYREEIAHLINEWPERQTLTIDWVELYRFDEDLAWDYIEGDAEDIRDWLEEHHDTKDELWVGYYKADAEQSGTGYGESVEEAICFGWIDGLINGIDDETYKRRFTPRKPDSKWSKKNKERVKTMVDTREMIPAGRELVEAAKESGEWEAAYRLADDHEIPDELESTLRENETAWEHFQAFSNTDQYAFIALVEAAKTDETKQKRIERTVELAEQDLRAYDENNKRRL